MISRARGRLLAAMIGSVAMIAGCADPGPSVAPPTLPPVELSRPPATDRPTPDLGAILDGEWRRVPVASGSLEVVGRLDSACRAAEPAIGDTPSAVVDARGVGRMVIVYAASQDGVAWECLAPTAAAGPGDVAVTALDAAGEPTGETDVQVADYRTTRFADLTAVVLVGRVGAHGIKVITQFDGDESFIYGSLGGGWFALWWPGAEPINSVAATDTHNAVIGEARPDLR